ncbi:DUF2243 domain-containing protein [Modestobacter muralis]|uniref:DUF2243 domain-containing protein n=1 Tax=Modestobacter muralis TaxID=1608614 RepID=A0A6P0HAZ9_9ACTN|nr:DUF2243 domain-containing protein [Modestobacter muralis]NEK95158.1 DUF2243 domain-containing protein [Modestobacter muralis]NEN52046.1 DUF2243 domain-containing protein [Modestobacter muralis]
MSNASSQVSSTHAAVTSRGLPGRSVLAGLLIGVGVAGFIDETVFHQLLHWHHSYDKSTPTAGLVSDGFFHAGSWIALVVGWFLIADMHRRRATVPRRVLAGGLLGWGAFQVYDGLFQHKVLDLHEIRYGVNLAPYDLIWNISGAIGILAGIALLFGSARPISLRPGVDVPETAGQHGQTASR